MRPAPESLKRWRRLVLSAMRAFEAMVDTACRLVKIDLKYPNRARVDEEFRRMGYVSVHHQAEVLIRSRKTPSGAPASLSKPKAAETYAILSERREKCSHTDEDGNPMVRKYTAGRAGNFSECLKCGRRWKYNNDSKTWEMHDRELVRQGASRALAPSPQGVISNSTGAAQPSEGASRRRPRQTPFPTSRNFPIGTPRAPATSKSPAATSDHMVEDQELYGSPHDLGDAEYAFSSDVEDVLALGGVS